VSEWERPEGGRWLIVENMRAGTPWTALKDHVREAGWETFCRSWDTNRGGLTAEGRVAFPTAEDALRARKVLNGSIMNGQRIRVYGGSRPIEGGETETGTRGQGVARSTPDESPGTHERRVACTGQDEAGATSTPLEEGDGATVGVHGMDVTNRDGQGGPGNAKNADRRPGGGWENEGAPEAHQGHATGWQMEGRSHGALGRAQDRARSVLGGRLVCAPADGDCFWHAIKIGANLQKSIQELRAEAGGKPGVWADEPHIKACVRNENLQLHLHLAEIHDTGFQLGGPYDTVLGDDGGNPIDLIHWTVGGDGVHFDVVLPGDGPATDGATPGEGAGGTTDIATEGGSRDEESATEDDRWWRGNRYGALREDSDDEEDGHIPGKDWQEPPDGRAHIGEGPRAEVPMSGQTNRRGEGSQGGPAAHYIGTPRSTGSCGASLDGKVPHPIQRPEQTDGKDKQLRDRKLTRGESLPAGAAVQRVGGAMPKRGDASGASLAGSGSPSKKEKGRTAGREANKPVRKVGGDTSCGTTMAMLPEWDAVAHCRDANAWPEEHGAPANSPTLRAVGAAAGSRATDADREPPTGWVCYWCFRGDAAALQRCRTSRTGGICHACNKQTAVLMEYPAVEGAQETLPLTSGEAEPTNAMGRASPAPRSTIGQEPDRLMITGQETEVRGRTLTPAAWEDQEGTTAQDGWMGKPTTEVASRVGTGCLSAGGGQLTDGSTRTPPSSPSTARGDGDDFTPNGGTRGNGEVSDTGAGVWRKDARSGLTADAMAFIPTGRLGALSADAEVFVPNSSGGEDAGQEWQGEVGSPWTPTPQWTNLVNTVMDRLSRGSADGMVRGRDIDRLYGLVGMETPPGFYAGLCDDGCICGPLDPGREDDRCKFAGFVDIRSGIGLMDGELQHGLRLLSQQEGEAGRGNGDVRTTPQRPGRREGDDGRDEWVRAGGGPGSAIADLEDTAHDDGEDKHQRSARGWRPPRAVAGLGSSHNPATCWGRYTDEEAEDRQQMANSLLSALAACSPHGRLGPQALQRLGQWAGFELPSHAIDWATGGLDWRNKADNACLMAFLDSAGGIHISNDNLKAALTAMGAAGAPRFGDGPGAREQGGDGVGGQSVEDQMAEGACGQGRHAGARIPEGREPTRPTEQALVGTPAARFEVGLPVLLHGLSRTELNGQRGIVVRATGDRSPDRVPVQLEDSGQRFLVKAGNLEVRAGADLSRSVKEALLAQAVADLREKRAD